MAKLFKLSLVDVKNILHSKGIIVCIIGAFIYGGLWSLGVHPKMYGLTEYSFEVSRFLYVGILYASILVIQNDIRFNTSKVIFSGIFSRVQIMISKFMSLIILGFVFSIAVELNNFITSLILNNKIGFSGFLALNHIEIIITIIVLTFSMGSIMVLTVAITFKNKKNTIGLVLFLSLINFYNAAIVMLSRRGAHLPKGILEYMKTPFYNATNIMYYDFPIKSILINVTWGIIFFIGATIIMNRREIK